MMVFHWRDSPNGVLNHSIYYLFISFSIFFDLNAVADCWQATKRYEIEYRQIERTTRKNRERFKILDSYEYRIRQTITESIAQWQSINGSDDVMRSEADFEIINFDSSIILGLIFPWRREDDSNVFVVKCTFSGETRQISIVEKVMSNRPLISLAPISDVLKEVSHTFRTSSLL